MKETSNTQIFISEDNCQNQFKYDVCRIIEELNKLPFDFYISGGVIGKFFLKNILDILETSILSLIVT